MTRISNFLAAHVLVLAVTLTAGAGLAHAQRIDMRSTKHNLAQGEGMGTVDSRQICVFCHTPTDTNHEDAVQPMWQQSIPVDRPFIMFDDIGQLGQAGNESVGSQSIACLSCHDNSQAFGVEGGGFDHPFAVPYRGALTPEARRKAREDARKAGRLIHQGKHVRNEDQFREASRGIIDNRPVWWVSKEGPSAQRGRLDVPLYVRIDQADQAEIPFIECASCHDPHTARPMFLRANANTTDLCLTCHVK